jgi:hypothetical protein
MFIWLCDDICDYKSLMLELFIPRCDQCVKSNGFIGSSPVLASEARSLVVHHPTYLGDVRSGS